MRELPAELVTLASKQAGLLNRTQLSGHGFSRAHIATRIKHGFWKEITDRVIALNVLPLTREQELWVVVLHHERAALTGVAALEFVGLKPEHSLRIDVLAERGGRAVPHPLWRLHTTRHVPPTSLRNPRRTRHPLSVLHAMGWAATPRQAVFYATWAIQQRLVTLDELQAVAKTLPPTRSSKLARQRLALVIPGAMSMLEHTFISLCAKYHLPKPRLQVPRVDSEGRQRYVDAVFDVGGRRVLVEIDGIGHLDAQVFVEDHFRANEITRANEVLLRIPGLALRMEPDRFMKQLRRALKPTIA